MLQLKEKTACIHKSNMCGRIPKARVDAQIHIGEYSLLIDCYIETSFNFIFKQDLYESMHHQFILSMDTFTITTFFLVFWSGIRLTKEHALSYMYFILSVRALKNGTWNTHSGCYSSPPLASSFLFPQLTSSCCQYMCHIRMSYSGNWGSEPTCGKMIHCKTRKNIGLLRSFQNFIIPFSPVDEVTQRGSDDIVPCKKKLCVIVSVNPSSEG